MTTPKKTTREKVRRLHRHANPVIHVESDESSTGPMIEGDDETVFDPARHRVDKSIGAVPEVPNLSPGGSVTIKR